MALLPTPNKPFGLIGIGNAKVKFEPGKIHYVLYMIFLSFKTYTIGISRIRKNLGFRELRPDPL